MNHYCPTPGVWKVIRQVVAWNRSTKRQGPDRPCRYSDRSFKQLRPDRHVAVRITAQDIPHQRLEALLDTGGRLPYHQADDVDGDAGEKEAGMIFVQTPDQ